MDGYLGFILDEYVICVAIHPPIDPCIYLSEFFYRNFRIAVGSLCASVAVVLLFVIIFTARRYCNSAKKVNMCIYHRKMSFFPGSGLISYIIKMI